MRSVFDSGKSILILVIGGVVLALIIFAVLLLTNGISLFSIHTLVPSPVVVFEEQTQAGEQAASQTPILPTLTSSQIPTSTRVPTSVYTPTPVDPEDGELAVSLLRAGVYNIYLSNLVGSNLQPLSFSTDPAASYAPSWSPDGSMIAYVSSDTGDTEILVLTLGESEPVNLTNSPSDDFSPAWSPNGDRIAFVSDRSGTPQVYVIDFDGTNLRQVTNNTGYTANPSWSPDGSQIAFINGEGRDYDIYRIGINGENKQIILDDEFMNSTVSWSSDGNKLVFVSNDRAESREAFFMNINGTDLFRLTFTSAAVLWAEWSQDGEFILIAIEDSLILFDADGSTQQVLFSDPGLGRSALRP